MAPYLLVIAVLRRRREREARRKRTFRIREIFKKREEFMTLWTPSMNKAAWLLINSTVMAAMLVVRPC